jgi:hypothetical protein
VARASKAARIDAGKETRDKRCLRNGRPFIREKGRQLERLARCAGEKYAVAGFDALRKTRYR